MRLSSELEKYRFKDGPYGSHLGERSGAFEVPGPCGRVLRIIASEGNDEIHWEHVSVSLPNRCPNWEEMCFVKALFWDDEDTVMQLHPPRSQWVNNHNYCLHMWRPLYTLIPCPPPNCGWDTGIGG